ncbi:MAG: AAA family ATPase [Trebonia sp.]
MSTREAEGVLLTGVYGLGKSSVAQEIAHLLEQRGEPFALLDLDYFSWAGTVLAFARKYHLREIAEHSRFTPDGHERLPVCRVGLTGNTGMKDLNRPLLEFYGHPGRHRGTTAQMAHRALDCVQSCRCRLLIIDDLHFLRWGRTNGIEVSNHFKYIANEFPVTLLMVGVGLAAKGLYSEGDSYDNAPLAQTGRRTTVLDMQPFRTDTDQHRREWRQLLLAIERKLVLADKFPGMLADELSDYLFARSTGHIASLMTLVNRGCQRAVRTGAERLDRELIDRVKNDVAAEKGRRELELALESGKITTRIGKQGKAPAGHDACADLPDPPGPAAWGGAGLVA